MQSSPPFTTEPETGFATNKIDGKFATIAINIQIADCSKKYIATCTTAVACPARRAPRCAVAAVGDAEWRDPLRFAPMHYNTCYHHKRKRSINLSSTSYIHQLSSTVKIIQETKASMNNNAVNNSSNAPY